MQTSLSKELDAISTTPRATLITAETVGEAWGAGQQWGKGTIV